MDKEIKLTNEQFWALKKLLKENGVQMRACTEDADGVTFQVRNPYKITAYTAPHEPAYQYTRMCGDGMMEANW